MMHKLMAWLLVAALVTTPVFAGAAEADGNSSASVSAAELQEMKALLKAQAEALQQQRAALERAEQQVRELQQRLGVSAGPATLETAAIKTVAVEPKTSADEKPAPLYFRIGSANFTPGGFLDFVGFFRGTNVGSGVATTFGTIPYSNTVQGHMTETRFSSQASRLALKMETNAGANKVLGYVETDFVGAAPASQFVTSNSMTLRMRMYLADVRRGNWEFMGGQAWSLMTPARKGVGLMPAELLIPLTGDANYQVGFPWARQAQFRVTYHPTDNTALAFSVENPQQFVGSGEVIYPFAFNAQLATQFDSASTPTTPNAHPDIVVKVAHDRKLGSRAFHVEAGGIMRTFKAVNIPVGGPTFVSHSISEGGLTAGLNIEVFKNFTLVNNIVWGAGTGRYLAGLAPDVVVRPVDLGAGRFDMELSPVHSGSIMTGFEWQASKKTMLAGYYGGVYAQRNAFLDVTNPVPGRISGFGGQNSPNSANRAIQEGTVSLTQTFWRNPNFGALQFITQGSYVTRAPWYFAPGAPKNAHVFMSTAGIRYILP